MTGPVNVRSLVESATPPTHTVVDRQNAWWTRLDRTSRALLLTGEFALILAIWQIAVGVFELVNPLFLPPPSRIAQGLSQLVRSGEIWPHLALSARAWITGYLLAVVCGVVLGTLVGRSVPLYRLAGPLLWSFYSIPWLAYRPVTVAWFGFGLGPIVFLVFIASLFPTLFNTTAGVGATEESLLDAGKVFGSSRLAIYRKIVIPSSLPFIFAGMRQSVVLATIALLVAEMTGSTTGIGALITIATNSYQTDQAYAAIVVSIVWTVGISQAVKIMSRRLAPWQTAAGR